MFSAAGLFVASGVCVLSGLLELARGLRLRRVGRTATARIAAGKPSEEDADAPPPRLRFRTEDGLDVEVVERGRKGGRGAGVGAEVLVLYDPTNPENARRKEFSELFGPSLFWIAFALLLGLGGVVQAAVG